MPAVLGPGAVLDASQVRSLCRRCLVVLFAFCLRRGVACASRSMRIRMQHDALSVRAHVLLLHGSDGRADLGVHGRERRLRQVVLGWRLQRAVAELRLRGVPQVVPPVYRDRSGRGQHRARGGKLRICSRQCQRRARLTFAPANRRPYLCEHQSLRFGVPRQPVWHLQRKHRRQWDGCMRHPSDTRRLQSVQH